jgi:hypothetical protein
MRQSVFSVLALSLLACGVLPKIDIPDLVPDGGSGSGSGQGTSASPDPAPSLISGAGNAAPVATPVGVGSMLAPSSQEPASDPPSGPSALDAADPPPVDASADQDATLVSILPDAGLLSDSAADVSKDVADADADARVVSPTPPICFYPTPCTDYLGASGICIRSGGCMSYGCVGVDPFNADAGTDIQPGNQLNACGANFSACVDCSESYTHDGCHTPSCAGSCQDVPTQSGDQLCPVPSGAVTQASSGLCQPPDLISYFNKDWTTVSCQVAGELNTPCFPTQVTFTDKTGNYNYQSIQAMCDFELGCNFSYIERADHGLLGYCVRVCGLPGQPPCHRPSGLYCQSGKAVNLATMPECP